MIQINLLPREERIKRRTFPVLKVPALGAAAPFVVLGVLAVVVVTVSMLQRREIARLETEVATLKAERSRYQPQLERIRQMTQKRQDVQNRLDIIAKLDRERYYRVKLMDTITRSAPKNLWLTKVSETSSNQFAIEGVTFSNLLVARFMQNLEAAPHWENVDLQVARKGKIDQYDVVQFGMVSGARP